MNEQINGTIQTYPPNIPPKKDNTAKIIKIVVAVFVALFVLGILLFAGIFFGVTAIIKNSDSYKTAITFIEECEDVNNAVGEITGYGFFVNGGASTVNGEGEANYVIKVEGEDGTTSVWVSLEKNPGQDWIVVEYRVGTTRIM